MNLSSAQKRTPLFWACLSQKPPFVPTTPNGKREKCKKEVLKRVSCSLSDSNQLLNELVGKLCTLNLSILSGVVLLEGSAGEALICSLPPLAADELTSGCGSTVRLEDLFQLVITRPRKREETTIIFANSEYN